jgi:hypothetical protein
VDGAVTVWPERRRGQPENSLGLFERRADGSVVEVGPVVPPSAPSGTAEGLLRQAGLQEQGMSADGSRMFFTLGADYWPGDSTQVDAAHTGGIEVEGTGYASLYEYLGTGNASPLLVGVGDSGALVSQCGVQLGGSTEPFGGTLSQGVLFGGNAVSVDGNTVFFTAFPDNYEGDGCSGAAPPVAEVLARIGNGLPGAHTVAISEPSEEDCAACYENGQLKSGGQLADAVFVGASEDGSKVFFETTQPLLGTDTSNNIYEYDFDAPPGQRVLRVSAGDATVSNPAADVIQGDGNSYLRVLVSQDGSHVYFVASGVLTRAPNGEGESAEAGAPNLYVFERDAEYPSGHVGFVARLSQADMEQGLQMNVTPDGRFLVLASSRDLTPDDTSTVRQVFEYDAQTGVLERVSVGQDGYNDDGNTSANFASINQTFVEGYSPSNYWTYLSVSADGSYVFFQSSAALTPQALEGFNNVYEYHDERVSLISDGQDIATVAGGESVVKLLGTDASGEDVFFTTADRLVGQDVDSAVDIYDARVDGGFPGPAAPAGCAGEGCQGALSGAPTLLSPGSEFQAGGNPPLAGEPAPQPKVKKRQPKSKKRRPAHRARSVGRRDTKRPGAGRGGSHDDACAACSCIARGVRRRAGVCARGSGGGGHGWEPGFQGAGGGGADGVLART